MIGVIGTDVNPDGLPYTHRITLVVTKAFGDSYNASQSEPPFTVPLVPDPSPTLTDTNHYWLSAAVTEPQDTAWRATLADEVAAGHAWLFDGNTTSPDEILAQLGLQRQPPSMEPTPPPEEVLP